VARGDFGDCDIILGFGVGILNRECYGRFVFDWMCGSMAGRWIYRIETWAVVSMEMF